MAFFMELKLWQKLNYPNRKNIKYDDVILSDVEKRGYYWRGRKSQKSEQPIE